MIPISSSPKESKRIQSQQNNKLSHQHFFIITKTSKTPIQSFDNFFNNQTKAKDKMAGSSVENAKNKAKEVA